MHSCLLLLLLTAAAERRHWLSCVSGAVQHVARWCLLDADSPKKGPLPDKTLHDIDKFCESCWKVRAQCRLA